MFKYIQKHNLTILGKITKHRLLALDVLRGITIMAMILVNNPGNWSTMYGPLKHAQWHGWTVTDLIFPFFIFIVGASISFSITIQKKKGLTNKEILFSAAKRAVKLILLGWFLTLFYYQFGNSNFNWFNDKLFSMRIMGVLQRIGLVYLICTILFIYFKPRSLLILSLTILALHSFAMLAIPYVDIQNNITYQGLWLKGNNFSAWLDHLVLTPQHVYSQTVPFSYDPEGLFSTLPAIATCISGVLVGQYLKSHTVNLLKQIYTLLLIGVILYLLGLLLSGYIPINKALWTTSYVLISSGIAIVTLAICLYLIDIKHYKNWTTPFIVFGANSIAFFMFAGILGRILIMWPVNNSHLKHWINETLFTPYFEPINASLMFSFAFLLISYAVMFTMYRKNIFWKV